MHSIAGIIDDSVLLELAMTMHTRASSKLALWSLATLCILPALLQFCYVFTFIHSVFERQGKQEKTGLISEFYHKI